MGCVIIRPDQFGIVDDQIPEIAAYATFLFDFPIR
jgi:hypothetical protein